MKLILGVCLISLFSVCEAIAQDQLSCVLFDGFSHLLKQSRYGRDMNATEVSAWILQNETLQKWPGVAERLRDVWHGKIPDGVVAQAHVHPYVASPRPSTTDVATSKQIRMNIYTISTDAVWVVYPDGEILQKAGADWFLKYQKFCASKNDNTIVNFGLPHTSLAGSK